MVRNIRGKIFSSTQTIDKNYLMPNIGYMHILTCTIYRYNIRYIVSMHVRTSNVKLSFTILPFITFAALIRMKSHVSDYMLLCLCQLVRPRTWCERGSQVMNMINTL